MHQDRLSVVSSSSFVQQGFSEHGLGVVCEGHQLFRGKSFLQILLLQTPLGHLICILNPQLLVVDRQSILNVRLFILQALHLVLPLVVPLDLV